jgi:hypothetical protein
MSHPRSHLSRSRTFWSLRYKIYVVLLLVMVTPLLTTTNPSTPNRAITPGQTLEPVNFLYSNVLNSKDSLPNLVRSVIGVDPFEPLNIQFEDQNFANEVLATQKKTLNELVRIPKDVKYRGWLIYPKFGVNAPVIFSQLEDIYETNKDGIFKKNGNGQLIEILEKEEDIKAGNYLSTPTQNLLTKGAVHLANSSDPGELGNSYIIGHTSNFPSVVSDYNFVFKPFNQKSSAGDEFIIFDREGRELHFEVFETLTIKAEEGGLAISKERFKDERVVTLQGSILDFYQQPTQRWLTRGRLVLK